MDVTEFLKGRFLKADELTGRPPLVLRIKNVAQEEFQGDSKLVLEFHNFEQKLTLNKSRLLVLAQMFGSNTVLWIDREITLVSMPIASGRFAGQATIVILAAPPAQTAPPQAAAPGPQFEF
jgi:hypothetical protein